MAVGMIVVMLFSIVRMLSVTMVVPAMSQHNKTNKVRSKAAAADDQNELGTANHRRFDESGDGLENNRNTQRDKKDRIEETTKDFGSYPLSRSQSPVCVPLQSTRTYTIGKLVRALSLGDSNRPKTDCKGYYVVQHMEGVCSQCQRVNHKAGDQLDEEEHGVNRQHNADSG